MDLDVDLPLFLESHHHGYDESCVIQPWRLGVFCLLARVSRVVGLPGEQQTSLLRDQTLFDTVVILTLHNVRFDFRLRYFVQIISLRIDVRGWPSVTPRVLPEHPFIRRCLLLSPPVLLPLLSLEGSRRRVEDSAPLNVERPQTDLVGHRHSLDYRPRGPRVTVDR